MIRSEGLVCRLIVASAMLLATHAFAQDSSVRIGYLLDLSGKGAFMGLQSQAGAQLALRDLKADGIDVTLFVEDHRTDGKTGASAAQKLISVDQVDALMCDLTPPCVAASSLARSAKKLFLYQAPVDSIRRDNEYAFKSFLDYEAGCRAIAQHWKEAGIKRIAHLKVNAEFGELCLRGARSVGIEQVVEEYDAGSDLRSIAQRLKTRSVGAVLQTGYEGDYIARMRASAEIAHHVPTGMPQPLLTAEVERAVPPVSLENSVVFGFTELPQDFAVRLKDAGLYQGPTAIESAGIAYTLVTHAVRAVVACGQGSVDCHVKEIERSHSELLGFQEWADRAARYTLVMRQVRGGVLRPLAGVIAASEQG